jgi:hypothetical protein
LLAAALPAAAAPTQAARIASLPSDRLHFGLANGPGDLGWMTSSNVPWRYRYQYLSCGVNTGCGWETWWPGSGNFAANYMTDSTSGGASYIPVFTYYDLLQSNPSTGSNELDRDYSNLNNAATMAAYYSNFKLLMTKANAYVRPVVVHVEPDFWGFMHQKAIALGGTTATSVPASVASSGNADLASYENNVQGFACGLHHLRDLYDTNGNVKLAIHASMWSSGRDVASDTDPSLNPVAEADLTAAYLNSACISTNKYGGSTWDLVFNDIDDHDAGWWEKQGLTPGFTHWWDPSNTAYPNFTRYLSWVSELHVKTGRQQVAWQVPVGNQYFLTMNNTDGHYQDNSAGIIAVLFGKANEFQTTYTDYQADRVTNNLGVPTTDLAGYCNACNTHMSVWPDDDGGFLRIFVGRYYGVRFPVSQGPAPPTPPARGVNPIRIRRLPYH